jgi:DNA-binding beta-propeller fold protein YncE
MLKFFSLSAAVMAGLLAGGPAPAGERPRAAEPLGKAGQLLAEYKFEATEPSGAGFRSPLTVSPAEDLIIVTQLGAPVAEPKPTPPLVQIMRLKWDPKPELVKGPTLRAPSDYRGNMFRCSAFSPDGKVVVVSSQDVKSDRWDDKWAVLDFYRTSDGVKYKSLHREKGPDFVQALCYSPDGKSLAVAYDVHNKGGAGSFGLWDLSADTFRQFGDVGPERCPSQIQFNADGTRVATSESYSGVVQVWDVKSGKVLAKDDPIYEDAAPLGAMGANRSMRFSQDGKTLISSSEENVGRIRTRSFDLFAKKKVAEWRMPTQEAADTKRRFLDSLLSQDGELMLTSEEVRRGISGEKQDFEVYCELTDLKTTKSLFRIQTFVRRDVKAGRDAMDPRQCLYLSRDARFAVTLDSPGDGGDSWLRVWATGLAAR